MNSNRYKLDYQVAIQQLSQSKYKENLAVFMGSGVSSFVNPNYPIWNGVTQRLKKELAECKTDDALDVAQEYLDKYGKEKLAETVSSLFPDSTPNQEFYNELLKCRPQYLLTTNWDNMLQNAIQDGLYMYETIADDKELMDSSLLNKYVKIHGDFQHDFVLTRSSYDSYSKDYPLIENFVKSVLCTNTVIFIGYSLSDEDFKQILEWIKISAPAEPRFYCAFDESHYNEQTEAKFNKEGIATFTVPDFTDLFKKLNKNEIGLFANNPVNTFAQMIKPLCEDKAVLLSSLTKFVSNCGFAYFDEYRAALQLYTIELTGDYKKASRVFFQNFIENLLNGKALDKDALAIINDVFSKAGIIGLIHNSSSQLLLKNDYNDESSYYTNFNYDYKDNDTREEKIKKLYENFTFENKDLLEEAYTLCLEVIKSDIQEKNYRKLFISYFNLNKIINYLNRAMPAHNAMDYIDIEKKYHTLPANIQNQVSDIYNFVMGDTLRNDLIDLMEDIRKIKDKVQNSYMAMDKDRYRWAIEHKNLNDFVLLNNFLIENSHLFRQVQQTYVEIAILRKSTQGNNIKLNRNELFSCIRYFDIPTNHHTLLKIFIDNKVELVFEENDENWLINEVLPNCIKIYQNPLTSSSKPYLFNVLSIFSRSRVSEKNVGQIINQLFKILKDCFCNNNILCIIRNLIFTFRQKYSEQIKETAFLPIFVSIVNKYLNQRALAEEQFELEKNNCGCYELIYKTAIDNGEIFDDIKLIKQLQKLFETVTFDRRTEFYINCLMPLYCLGNEKIKKYLSPLLKKFLDIVPEEPAQSKFGGILWTDQIKTYENWYKLKLIEIDIKPLEQKYISELEEWIKTLLQKQGASSDYSLVIQEVFLLYNKYKQFSVCAELCQKLREKYNSMRFLQI